MAPAIPLRVFDRFAPSSHPIISTLPLPVLSSLTQTPSFRPKAAHFAAAVEKSAAVFAVAVVVVCSLPNPTQTRHFDRRRRTCRRSGENLLLQQKVT